MEDSFLHNSWKSAFDFISLMVDLLSCVMLSMGDVAYASSFHIEIELAGQEPPVQLECFCYELFIRAGVEPKSMIRKATGRGFKIFSKSWFKNWYGHQQDDFLNKYDFWKYSYYFYNRILMTGQHLDNDSLLKIL